MCATCSDTKKKLHFATKFVVGFSVAVKIKTGNFPIDHCLASLCSAFSLWDLNFCYVFIT